ncbi:PPE family protein [Mycobacterium attenuatum]|uniref:PPE family protein n=1 Tax=Mycobacterium attenuatum TaxID=2341086 RepID=UPI000F01D108|nr:PPE family protein [Mycobacterium attenuatum]
MDFMMLPPETNSALMYGGAGSGPLLIAAAAWEGLTAELQAAASSFDAVISGLTAGHWLSPAALAMTAAAAPYVSWLAASAAQAQGAATQARVAATAFEAAQTSTVHPAAVTANRVLLGALVATNFVGQNTPAVAAAESDYTQMWAQDVAAMVGYHAGAMSVAAALTSLAGPPVDVAGLASQLGAAVAPVVQGAVGAAASLVSAVQSVTSAVPVQSLTSLAQVAMYPLSILMSPLMSLAQGANSAGLAGAAAAGPGVDAPKFVGDSAPSTKGVGAGISAGVGQARLVGAMSVPPTWSGSMPARLASSVMPGLGAMGGAAAEPAQAAGGTGGVPMMPLPMGGTGGGGMAAGMVGRGGSGAHVVQPRPSVVPRTGIG